MTVEDMQVPRAKVDADAFRRAMGEIATPVTVVTTAYDGVHLGTTVSAFASLSLEPAMVLVCLDKASTLVAALHRGSKLGINLLSEEQAGDAIRFARKSSDKFSGAFYHLDMSLPRLDASAGWLACEVAEVLDGGDHYIITAYVEHVDHTGRSPMVYHNRTFGGFAA